MSAPRRTKSSQAQQDFQTPNTDGDNYLVERDGWIDKASSGFITNSKANRQIYRVILETLWPKGYGIPGPIVGREEIRAAIDRAKGGTYHDPFRRLRELQGDEGFLGIIKNGQRYQLIHLNISPKKRPRTSLSADKWKTVLGAYNNVCAVCGCTPDENGFQQDHKVPRARGGTDDLTNWQPLCDSCNIEKSVVCRGCQKDCSQCGYAFPEFYRPVRLSGQTWRDVNEYSEKHHLDPSQFVTEVIYHAISIEYDNSIWH